MSRYRIPHPADHDCYAGWDNPLQTFFLTVYEPADTELDDSQPVFQIGQSPHEVTTPEALQEHALTQGIDLSEWLPSLRADKCNAPALTEFQKMNLGFLTDINQVLLETCT